MSLSGSSRDPQERKIKGEEIDGEKMEMLGVRLRP